MYLTRQQFSIITGKPTKLPGITTVLEKGSGDINEDEVLVGRRTYGVFDGATSLVPAIYNSERTGGRLAVEICKQVFGEETDSLIVAAEKANKEICRQSVAAGVNLRCKEEHWSCSAAVVKMYSGFFEWVQLGDCRLLIIKKDGSYQLLGRNPGQDVSTLQQWQQKGGLASGSVMEVMAEEILAVRRRMNIDFGVFNGEQQALAFLETGRVDLDGISDVLLFSDGLELPQEAPASAPDFDHFIALYQRDGLEAVRAYVRARELEDIGCIKYPRFKPHDDISGVAISF
ncbi:MAG: protein phosphatase 2C domain-containing protein [Desulfocapsaceae bacterium]|nr:protein phosphatase 2C domain-containing protein [Desulfocapsaceae bacterium]